MYLYIYILVFMLGNEFILRDLYYYIYYNVLDQCLPPYASTLMYNFFSILLLILFEV